MARSAKGRTFVLKLAKFVKAANDLDEFWGKSQKELADDVGSDDYPPSIKLSFDEWISEELFPWLETQGKIYNVPQHEISKQLGERR